jgi:hypothetical protein
MKPYSWATKDSDDLVSVDAPGVDRDLAYSSALAVRRSSVTHSHQAVVASTYDRLGPPGHGVPPTLGNTTYAGAADGRLLAQDLPPANKPLTWTSLVQLRSGRDSC